jgi:hypothetical protein
MTWVFVTWSASIFSHQRWLEDLEKDVRYSRLFNFSFGEICIQNGSNTERQIKKINQNMLRCSFLYINLATPEGKTGLNEMWDLSKSLKRWSLQRKWGVNPRYRVGSWYCGSLLFSRTAFNFSGVYKHYALGILTFETPKKHFLGLTSV